MKIIITLILCFIPLVVIADSPIIYGHGCPSGKCPSAVYDRIQDKWNKIYSKQQKDCYLYPTNKDAESGTREHPREIQKRLFG